MRCFFSSIHYPFISSIIPSVQNVIGCQLVGHGTMINLESVSWLQSFCEGCCVVIGCIDRFEVRKKIAFVKCQVVLFSLTRDNVLTGYGFSLHLFHDSNFSEAPTGMCSILKKHEGSEIQIIDLMGWISLVNLTI